MEDSQQTPSNHYVNKEELNAAMLKWHHAIVAAKAAGSPIPQMPRFVAECVIKQAQGMAKKSCYRDYSWIDEMIQDGIEVCALYLHNYNPEADTRSGEANAYGYINKAIERAFNTRLDMEKQEEYLKCKSVVLLSQSGDLEAAIAEEAGGDDAQTIIHDFIDRSYQYEANQKARAEKAAARKAKRDAKKPQKPTLMRFFKHEQ